MAMSCFLLLLLLLLFLAAQCLAAANPASNHHESGSSSSRDSRKLLDYINRPFVTTLNLSDGSIVDCVKIQDQLGVQHPLLKNHKIMSKPSVEVPESLFSTKKRFHSSSGNATHHQQRQPWQLFHHEHVACPEGTIPVRRLLLKDLERMQTPEIFLRKYPKEHQGQARARFQGKHGNPKSSSKNFRRGRKHLKPPAVDGHQYAIVQAVGSFSGSQAYLSIWDPAVATASDFSLSQIWLGAGAHDTINTVEAGWQVYELLNGDRSPHLFIFWTADSYKNSGCYNLRCPGFVQTSPRVLLGGAISSVSSPGSNLYFKKFLIFKDPVAWWLQIDDEWVGYWPASLFTTMGETSQWMQWGGEVCLSGASDGPQLSTQMGSGFFPTEGNAKAASQCELSYLDSQMRPYDAVELAEFSTDPQCYTAKNYYDQTWGSYLVFGGQGCQP